MPDPLPADLLKAVVEISAAAAPIPMRYFRADVAVEDKPDESPVTIADRETERAIRAAIEARYPGHGIFGEEFGRRDTEAEYVWIIDPIDGTRSFICGVPLFGMLLGVLHQGAPVAGVIRMPGLGETYAGSRGGGATLNGKPIKCRNVTKPGDARLFINEAIRMVDSRARTARSAHAIRPHPPLLQRLLCFRAACHGPDRCRRRF